jgi:hypothetical protein
LAAAFQTYWAACSLDLGCQTLLLVQACLGNHPLGFLLESFCLSHNSVRQTVNLKEKIYICDLRVLLNSAHDCSEVGRLAAAALHSITQFAVQHLGWLHSCTSVKVFFCLDGYVEFSKEVVVLCVVHREGLRRATRASSKCVCLCVCCSSSSSCKSLNRYTTGKNRTTTKRERTPSVGSTAGSYTWHPSSPSASSSSSSSSLLLCFCAALFTSVHAHSPKSTDIPKYPLTVTTFPLSLSLSLSLSPPSLPYLYNNHHRFPAAANCTRSIMNPNNSREQYQQSSSPSWDRQTDRQKRASERAREEREKDRALSSVYYRNA